MLTRRSLRGSALRGWSLVTSSGGHSPPYENYQAAWQSPPYFFLRWAAASAARRAKRSSSSRLSPVEVGGFVRAVKQGRFSFTLAGGRAFQRGRGEAIDDEQGVEDGDPAVEADIHELRLVEEGGAFGAVGRIEGVDEEQGVDRGDVLIVIDVELAAGGAEPWPGLRLGTTGPRRRRQ